MESLVMSEREFDVIAAKLDNINDAILDIKSQMKALPCTDRFERIVKLESKLNGHFANQANEKEYNWKILAWIIGAAFIAGGALLTFLTQYILKNLVK